MKKANELAQESCTTAARVHWLEMQLGTVSYCGVYIVLERLSTVFHS